MRTWSATLLAVLSSGVPAHAQGLQSLVDHSAEIGRLQQEVRQIDGRLQLVEKQYAYRAEPAEQEALKRRYSDAEIQFLLTNYPQSTVLLYDLIGNKLFLSMKEYPSSLYMLAEALYQQQNFLGARLYFREHMSRRGDHYRDALSRYLEISGRINDYSGIDGFIDQARSPDGTLPADVAYVYAKWLYRRTDIPLEQRNAKAQQVFTTIAEAGGAFNLQSHYFLGVLAVQRKDIEGAIKSFDRVVKLPAKDDRDRKVQELSNLSLGRLYFEQGKYDEAIDRYQEIDYRSEYFVDALYEIAWSHVRKAKDAGPEEFERANQACEKLLLAAPDSPLAPEARILQGQLLLKLKKFQEASDAYSGIINSYLEVYDNIDGRLKAHADPVKYFQKLIADSEKTFDITSFLPPLAVKWATTQREVAEAVRMTTDIDAGKKGVGDASEIAARLLETLDQRGMEIFPTLQEGFARAEAVDSALANVELSLLKVEEGVLGPDKLVNLKTQLDAVRKERMALEEKFKNLPKDESEIETRKKRMSDRFNTIDQEAFKLGYQVESINAVITGVEKFVSDTREERLPDAVAEREFAERIRQERQIAAGLRDDLAQVQKRLRDEKVRLGIHGGGEGEIRTKYEVALARERELMASARQGLSAPVQTLLASLDTTRLNIAGLKSRSKTAKETIRVSVQKKGEALREKVRDEAKALRAYEGEVKLAASRAQNLVGNIAYESFKRVRRQFYELVLKADIGLVDVAWTRKQDKTNQIQNLAKQKDKEMKGLDEEFKEVLKEVE